MKITNWLFRHPLKFALLIFVASLAFYASSLPSFNLGYADSDEFLAVGQNWGLAHPPGYSLYVSLLSVFMHLPIPFTTPAFRGHLLSAVLTAAALALCLIFFRSLFTSLLPPKRRRPDVFVLSAVIILLATATSKQLWLYSQITEKYLFSAPLIVSLIYLGFRLSRPPSASKFLHYIFGLCFGLLLAHHQSNIFLLPYFIFVLGVSITQNPQKLKAGLSAAGGLATGLAIWICLLLVQISRQATVPVTWQVKPGLTGLVNMITRADFRGEIYAQNITSNGYFPDTLSLARIGEGFVVYFGHLGSAYNWWIFLPLLMALVWLASRKPLTNFFLLVLPPLFMGPLLLVYLGWPKDLGTQAITQRFFLTSYLVYAPLLFLGLVEIFNRLNLAFKQLKLGRKQVLILGGIIPLLLVIQTVILYPQVSLKSFNLVSNLYGTELAKVKPNSLVTCYSDASCFALIYEQTVNRLRPDVDVVPLAYPLVTGQLAAKNLTKFNYPNNPFLLFDIVTHNLSQRPVYAFDLNRYYFSLFGVPNAFLYSLPDGYKIEFSRTMPETLPPTNSAIAESLLNQNFPSFDKYRLFLVESVAQAHTSNSYTYLKRGERSKAQQELSLAVNLAYRLTKSQTDNVVATRENLESIQPDPRFAPLAEVPSAQTLLETLPEYYRRKQYAQALTNIMGALTVDPENLPARLELARLYQLLGDPNFSRLEYQHVLQLDPTNQEALAATQ